MKVPIVRLALIPFLLIVASVACARPTPTRLTVVVPGASPAPLTSPVILSDIPASPLPGRRFRYVTLPAACTAPAVEPSYEAKAGSTASSNPASALHIVSTVDASHDLDAPGSESSHAILDTELAEIDPRETVLAAASALHPVPPEDGPAQHARFAPEAVDTRTASGDDTVYDESRAVAGRRGTVLAAVPTAVSDAPEPPTAKHPTLPKMIGYSVLLFGASSRLCARVKRTSLINSSSRALHLPLSPLLLEAHRTLHAPAAWATRPAAYVATLRPYRPLPLTRLPGSETRPSVNATTVQMAPTLRHPPSRRSTWETRELDAPAPPYNAAVPPDYAHTPNALDAPPPAYDDGGRHRTRAVYAIPPRF